MKIRGRLLMALLIIGILSCVVLPSVNAENFNIGEKMDSDLKIASLVYRPFTSGAIVRADDFEINLAPLIFDGNLSTGIETNYSIGDLNWKVYFRFPLYVNNITIKPSFGNGSSNYTLTLFVVDTIDREFNLAWEASGENIFQMNCYISAIDLLIHENGTDQFYFNDLIINYTPIPPHLEVLQNQINYLTSQIDMLNNTINELNNTINKLNQTQHQILESVTELYEIQYLIDQITQDIHKLNESIAEIKNTMPSEYNDTILLNRIFQLESKNAALSLEIENLTTEIENLNQEMDKLKDDKDELNNFVAFGAFIIGILGVFIAIVAIILASRKLGEQTPSADKEASEESIHSEEEENKVNEEES